MTPLLKTGGFIVHMPEGVKDYESLEDAVSESVKFMLPWLEARAIEAGGVSPKIDWSRHDEIAMIGYGAMSIHLWTRIAFNVSGEEQIK